MSCVVCGCTTQRNRKTCSEQCLKDLHLSTISPLRRAVETRDYESLVLYIKTKAEITHSGCWIWPKIKKDYPAVKLVGKWVGLHRLVVDLRDGVSKEMPVHHLCATTACVNPEHLVKVTHAQNVAEMILRNFYVSRIEALEKALFATDPGHPLLIDPNGA